MSNFLDKWVAEQRAEFMSHVRPEIVALVERGDITWAEYEVLRANSYERHLMHPRLTDDALLKLFDHCMQQLGNRFSELMMPKHYGEQVTFVLAPLLADRLRSRVEGEQMLIDAIFEKDR